MLVQLSFDVCYVGASREAVDEDASALPGVEMEDSFEEGNVAVANDTSRARHGRTTFVKAILANPSLPSAQILAQKFASDALKSPKVQETIRKLSDMKSQRPQQPLAHSVRSDIAKLPAESRNHHKSMRHQRPRKRKRKRLKEQSKRSRGHHPRSPTQRKYGSISEPKVPKKRRIQEKANFDVKQDRSFPSLSTHTEAETISAWTTEVDNVKETEGESMVQRLMKTTTKDPTKKSPGDQGIEYSEYYNDDDVLGEVPASKVRLKLEGTIKNPPVRFARQTANASSFYDYQLGNNYVQTHQPYFNGAVDRTNSRYDGSSGSVKNIQNYPEALQDKDIQISDGNSQRYQSNYGLTEQRDSLVDYSPVGITDSSLSDPTQLLNENESSLREPQTMTSSERGGQNNGAQRPIAKSRALDPADTMQQPFGKVLESLGISVNGSSRNDVPSPEDSFSSLPGNSPKSIRKSIGNPRAGLQYLKESSDGIWRKNDAESKGPWTNIQESDADGTKDIKNIRNDLQAEGAWMPEKSADTLDPVHEQANETKSGAKRKRAKTCRSSILEEERSNVSTTVKETKEVANQILNRIMDELEELKKDHTKNDMKEGVPCKLTGSWVTSQAGVRIDMRIKNHSMAVTLAAFTPEPARPGLINATWNVTGNVPFKRGGPFSLFATDSCSKTLAVFVGACRVCQGVDTIEGIWSIAREPRDCRDFSMATRVVNDVFRRTRMSSETKQKLQSLLQGCATNSNSNSNTTDLPTTEITTTVPKKKRA